MATGLDLGLGGKEAALRDLDLVGREAAFPLAWRRSRSESGRR